MCSLPAFCLCMNLMVVVSLSMRFAVRIEMNLSFQFLSRSVLEVYLDCIEADLAVMGSFLL